MRRAIARDARATKSIYASIDWTFADDSALVAGMLAKNVRAWLQFSDRFDDLIEARIIATLRRCSAALCTAGQIEKIGNRVASFLKAGNMGTLRAFDARRGSLSAWLERAAEQSTLLHLENRTRLLDDEEVADLDLA